MIVRLYSVLCYDAEWNELVLLTRHGLTKGHALDMVRYWMNAKCGEVNLLTGVPTVYHNVTSMGIVECA